MKKYYYNIIDIINLIYNEIYFKLSKITFKGKKIIKGRIFIRGGKNIVIGSNCLINSGRRYNPIGGDSKTILWSKGGKISLGNNIKISNVSIVSEKSITIEDNVMIGANVKIYDTDFHSINNRERNSYPDNNVKRAEIIIKNGVFIGAHSIILKGVIIGENSVIGAGSVLTKSIPKNEIWAGNPAKFIRKI